MNREKAKELLSKAIDPNTAPAALAELRDLIESDTVTIESLTADNTNKSEQIAQLQKDNVKLFLQTGKADDPARGEPEKNAYELFEEKIKTSMKEVFDNGKN